MSSWYWGGRDKDFVIKVPKAFVPKGMKIGEEGQKSLYGKSFIEISFKISIFDFIKISNFDLPL